jgi:hypothetical protein
MEKSKLFEDVHVSAPTFQKPLSVLNNPVDLSGSPVQAAYQKNRGGFWFFVGGALCLAVSVGLGINSSLSSKPNVVAVKAPSIGSAFATPTPPAAPQAFILKQGPAAAPAVVLAPASAAAVPVPLATASAPTAAPQQAPAAPARYLPISIDQHGVILTVGGQPYQCSARSGTPVCVSILGYRPLVAIQITSRRSEGRPISQQKN